jgi:hypothetical protein
MQLSGRSDGEAYGTAMSKSILAILECELLGRTTFKT